MQLDEIKRGDSLILYCDWEYEDTGEPLLGIANQLKSQARTRTGQLMIDFSVSPDPVVRGRYVLTAPNTDGLVPNTKLYIDVEYNDGNVVRSTPTFTINVIGDVTQGGVGISRLPSALGMPMSSSTQSSTLGGINATVRQLSSGVKVVRFGLKQGVAGPPGQQGPIGPMGPAGAAGLPGVGIPVGGNVGDVLVKSSGTDYATVWSPMEYVHTQSIPSTTWMVSNPLPKRYPRVTVLDSNGNKVYADIRYIDASSVEVSFFDPFVGTCILN